MLLAASWRRRFWPGPSPAALILAYHRIAEPCRDPNLLCVSPHHFQEHLEVILSRWQPIRLSGLTQDSQTRSRVDPSIAITFDDGYRDNLYVAAPMMRAAGVPATVFLAAAYIGSDREFWWEELERIVFDDASEDREIQAEVGGNSKTWHLYSDS